MRSSVGPTLGGQVTPPNSLGTWGLGPSPTWIGTIGYRPPGSPEKGNQRR